MERKTAPCKGCEDRRPHCHASCEANREFRAWRDYVSAERKKIRETEYFVATVRAISAKKQIDKQRRPK